MSVRRRIDLRVLSLFLCAVGILGRHHATAAERPNVLFILADDMGYSDAGCFGGEISTPALDRLADEGIRLTRCMNGGMCVVTRASLLTGRWWPRALPAFGEIPLLSEKLKQSGYHTALIGKWHLDLWTIAPSERTRGPWWRLTMQVGNYITP